MEAKKWLAVFATVTAVLLVLCIAAVVVVDPLMHYHSPLTEIFFYPLDNERSFGNGILRNTEYDALITGTSMTENFKTSEMDLLFGTDSAKVTFAAGSFYEINNNIADALRYNPNLKTVVRCLDFAGILDDANRMVVSGSDYPDYLYDDALLNDCRYVLNNDILFGRVYRMLRARFLKSFTPGMTSFDEYANWMYSEEYSFGSQTLCAGLTGDLNVSGESASLSESDREKILTNIRQNVTAIPQQYPDVTFYYYISPYCAVWWQLENSTGAIGAMVEAERLAVEEILKCDNIRLYSFNTVTDITCDLNNYKDMMHYGEWVNTVILRMMRDGEGLLTEENYEEYFRRELELYTNYDYNSLLLQEDYEDDSLAREALYRKLGY